MSARTVSAPGRPVGRGSSMRARAGLPSPNRRASAPVDEDASLPLPLDDDLGFLADDDGLNHFGAARLGIP